MQSHHHGFSRRLILAFATLSLSAAAALAQTDAPEKRTVDVWTAGTLGLGGSPGGVASVAGQFAVSTAIDQRLFTVRAAGIANFSDYPSDRDYADVALLVGRRIANPPVPDRNTIGGMTASVAAGVAGLFYDHEPTVAVPRETGVVPALAFNADAVAHLRFVGVGFSVFGASGFRDRYVGVGLTLALGKIH